MKVLGVLSKSYNEARPQYISGVDFWRVERPLLALAKHTGWDVQITRKFLPDNAKVGDKRTEEALERVARDHQLIFTSYFSSEAGARAYAYVRALQARHGLRFAMDVDDNFIHMNPTNPATLYFKDGSQEMFILKAITTDVDWLTTTTAPLAAFYRDYRRRQGNHGPKDPASVLELPNFIDTTYWPTVSPRTSTSKRVHIVYMGSSHHHGDLWGTGFIKAVMRLLDKYPHIRFTCVGMPPLNPAVLDEEGGYTQFTHPQLTYHEGKNLGEGYADLFGSLHADIYCAPLEENYFNSQKSSIKMQEAGLSGGAFIASDVTPYKNSVARGETGLLVRNTRMSWEIALEDLITDTRKRRRLARANQMHVLDKWALSNNIDQYRVAFEHIMEAQAV